jgi:hypothetical protein
MHPSICRSVTCALVPNLTFFTEQSVGLSSRQTYLPLLILYTDDINKTGFLIYSQLFFVIQSDTILQNMTELHGRVVSTPASYSGESWFKSRPEHRLLSLKMSVFSSVPPSTQV